MWLGSGSIGMPLFQREARARIGTSLTPSIMVKAIASSMWECSTALHVRPGFEDFEMNRQFARRLAVAFKHLAVVVDDQHRVRADTSAREVEPIWITKASRPGMRVGNMAAIVQDTLRHEQRVAAAASSIVLSAAELEPWFGKCP